MRIYAFFLNENLATIDKLPPQQKREQKLHSLKNIDDRLSFI